MKTIKKIDFLYILIEFLSCVGFGFGDVVVTELLQHDLKYNNKSLPPSIFNIYPPPFKLSILIPSTSSIINSEIPENNQLQVAFQLKQSLLSSISSSSKRSLIIDIKSGSSDRKLISKSSTSNAILLLKYQPHSQPNNKSTEELETDIRLGPTFRQSLLSTHLPSNSDLKKSVFESISNVIRDQLDIPPIV